jgi:hypothetical protein
VYGFHMERLALKKLNEVEAKEQCHIDISNWFTALEDLDAEVDINKVWETIRISKFQPMRVGANVNWKDVSHNLTKDVQDY